MIYDSPAQAETVLVVDLSNMAFRAFYANSELKTKDGRPSGHVNGAANMVQAMLRDLAPSVCAIYAYDGLSSKADRLEILPSYKGNREQRPFDPLPGVRELCQHLPGLHIEQERREGDDAIAYACELCAKKRVIVVSGDKDLWALLRFPNVKVYSPNLKRFVEPSDWLGEFHVLEAAKIPLAKSLFGDSSDNIEGVVRLQKKSVEPILNDSRCVDADSFYELIRDRPASMSENMWKKALEAEQKVKTNYKVVLANTTGFSKNSVKRVLKCSENHANLVQVLKNYECYAVLNRMGAIYE